MWRPQIIVWIIHVKSQYWNLGMFPLPSICGGILDILLFHVHIHAHAHIHVHACTNTHACYTCTCMYMHMRTHVGTHICTHPHTHSCAWTHTQACIDAHIKSLKEQNISTICLLQLQSKLKILLLDIKVDDLNYSSWSSCP